MDVVQEVTPSNLCSLTIAPSGQIAGDCDDFVTEKGGGRRTGRQARGGNANSGGLQSTHILFSACEIPLRPWRWRQGLQRYHEISDRVCSWKRRILKRLNCHIHLLFHSLPRPFRHEKRHSPVHFFHVVGFKSVGSCSLLYRRG